MSTPTTAIETLSVHEREDLLVGLAIALEGVAKEALVEGNKHFAAVSQGMADAIRVNADDWAREDVENAGFAAQQASEMLSRFRVEHPHRVVDLRTELGRQRSRVTSFPRRRSRLYRHRAFASRAIPDEAGAFPTYQQRRRQPVLTSIMATPISSGCQGPKRPMPRNCSRSGRCPQRRHLAHPCAPREFFLKSGRGCLWRSGNLWISTARY